MTRVKVNLCRRPKIPPESLPDRCVRVTDAEGDRIRVVGAALRDVTTFRERASGWVEGDLVWVRDPERPLVFDARDLPRRGWRRFCWDQGRKTFVTLPDRTPWDVATYVYVMRRAWLCFLPGRVVG